MAQPAFEGDVSEWGKINLEDFYDDDDDHSIASSHVTMSSGVGPRDTRPRLRDFEPEAARQVGSASAAEVQVCRVYTAAGAACPASCSFQQHSCRLPISCLAAAGEWVAACHLVPSCRVF